MLTIGYGSYRQGYSSRESWDDDEKGKEGADFLKKVEEESTNGLKIISSEGLRKLSDK